MTAPLRVALLGCGTVGSAVLRLIEDQAGDLTARIGRPIEVVTDMGKSRVAGFTGYRRTPDAFFTLFDRYRAERLIP